MIPAFRVWKHQRITFLAFPTSPQSNATIMVVDELGRNYGGWLSVDKFRAAQSNGLDIAAPLVGCKVQLSGRVIQE